MKAITVILSLVVSTVMYSQDLVKINKEGNLYQVTYYHDNGVVAQTGYIDADKKMQGTWTSFDVNGSKKSVGEYKDGKKTGTWLHTKEANTVAQVDYDANNRVSNVIELTSNLNQFSDDKTFMISYFHDNGQVAQKGFVDANKKMQGTWVSYTEDGIKKSTGEYKDGKKVGTWYFGENKDVVTQVDYGTDYRIASVYQLKSDKSQLADTDMEE